ncbi:hypothetical protein AB1Y20_003454 [Prymnesium parvum]|uniref:Uncharacterized protein n=1 Tax=Prymnesium parvum TaxID=97485 RepID=A0AB34JBR6_PRYPA
MATAAPPSHRVQRAVGEWLTQSADGYCAPTAYDDTGNCAAGHKGSFPLRGAVSRTWVLALRVCISHCLACRRCEYVSVSLKRRDCSWFHRCAPPTRLRRDGEGYRTARVLRRPGGSAAAANLSAAAGGACPSPTDVAKEQRFNEMVGCLQGAAEPPLDTSRLGEMMRRHLWLPPEEKRHCARTPFAEVRLAALDARARRCALAAGDSRWTAEGPADAPSSRCGRGWVGTAEARCLFAQTDALFIGNSVTRRQMYTVLDLLAGPAAHRQRASDLATLETVRSTSAAEANRSWIWDVASKSDSDAANSGYHAAQLVTVDLATGRHRFHLPHRMCGLGDAYSTFHLGRYKQWRVPSAMDELPHGWRGTKWFAREWRPVVSFSLDWPPPSGLESASACVTAVDDVHWAGSFADGFGYSRAAANESRFSSEVRRAVLAMVREYFGAQEWVANVSVQTERPRGGAALSRRALPSVWVYFPTFHGERETFNGFCEDKPCNCTGARPKCYRHPQCRGKHLCAPMAAGSAAFVDAAVRFAAALRRHPHVASRRVGDVRLTPFYDDCWRHRGRCQGHRPCPEPVDAATSCRATALLCPHEPWAPLLARAKQWIPAAHPSASLLYVYDGHWSAELFDETFRAWGPASVGYGADLVVFGPQFGRFSEADNWPRSLRLVSDAMERGAACIHKKPLVVFRSPAYNFDPVNSLKAQMRFSSLMRPLVEAAGMLYLDNFESTFRAAFQKPPAIKFARGSTFHYVNEGRYLMAQNLLHLLRIVSDPAALNRT